MTRAEFIKHFLIGIALAPVFMVALWCGFAIGHAWGLE